MTFAGKLAALAGAWGVPSDGVAACALGLALVALVTTKTTYGRWLLGEGGLVETRPFLWATAFASALVSLLWIAHYLHGGPRIVDATTYFLQGRALSHGALSWPVLEPTASFRGRFLDYLPGTATDPGTLAGIFPPGYPLLLAFGFSLHAPMIVGPLIAAALVFATYGLATTLARLRGETDLVEPVGRTAALLSFACAALRYHTADTMSHGATALFVVLAFDAALRGRAWIFGLAIGAAIATRPVSAMPVALIGLAVLVLRGGHAQAGHAHDRRGRLRDALAIAVGMLPGVALLLASQKAATGAWFASTQRMYYALSDGPPDCFRWGMGANVGCLYEHGEFVRARLSNGYGVVAMLGTTLRRLRMHAMDVANFEPLVVVALLPAFARSTARSTTRGPSQRGPSQRGPSRPERFAVALVLLHVAAYAPFYFDGNYPGGGARFFADVLPVEHALLALALTLGLPATASTRPPIASSPPSSPSPARSRLFSARAWLLLGLAFAGFAVHASFDHVQLAERDGGLPMFEPDRLARAKIDRGLVFVDTDHGFALGHDPFASPARGIFVARRRGDARDRMLYEHLGKPPTYIYQFEIPQRPGAPTAASTPPTARVNVVPWVPPALDRTAHFEAETEWPARAQSGGFVAPAFVDTCASAARALVLTPTPETPAQTPTAPSTPTPTPTPPGASTLPPTTATAAFEIPVDVAGTYRIEPRIVAGAHLPFTEGLGAAPAEAIHGELSIEGAPEGPRWTWFGGASGCVALEPRTMVLTPPKAVFAVRAENGPVAIDEITTTKLD